MDINSINQVVVHMSDTVMKTPTASLVSDISTSVDLEQQALATRQFSSMMSGDVGQVSQSAGMHTSSITNSSALDGIEKFALNSDLNSDTRIPPATMGDGILTSMQNLSDNFKKVHEDVVRSLDNSGDMKLTDMLKLQINMSEMSFQWDAFSKVVTKSTQNLEQLLKLQ
jgi:hypothetical protein